MRLFIEALHANRGEVAIQTLFQRTRMLWLLLDDLLQRKAGDGAATLTLNPNAVQALQTVKQSLETALANPDANRASFMSNALIWLDIAKQDLFSANPSNDF